MEEKRLKIGLELHVVGDGRTFLNYWDAVNGDDVIAEVKDGKLYMDIEELETEVSLQHFIDTTKGKF
jgi:hypothetical protein